MGCGASKGDEDKKKDDPMNVKFGHTYCWSIDRFFEEAQRVVDDFKDMIGPIEEEKTNFLYVSGFHEVCGACKIFLLSSILAITQAFKGMFIAINANASVS